MRHFLLLLSLSGLLASTAASATPVAAGGAYDGYSGPGITNAAIDHGQAYRKHRAIVALERDGRTLQRADGGMLTPEHHALLQARLEAIQAGNY